MEHGKVTVEDFKDPVKFQILYLGQQPHTKQCEVLLSTNKNKIIVCGRRSGKSQMIAGEIIRGAKMKIYNKQIVIAPSFKQTLIVYNKIVELMNKAEVYCDIDKEIKSPYPQIWFKNGKKVFFGSADNPNSVRGESYDRIFIDESAFVKKGAMDAIKPLTFDTGAPIWETTTPWGKGDVWERWSRGKKGDDDFGCFHYNFRDNPYLHPDGVKEIEKDIEEFGESSVYVQAEIYGNFIEDRDCYFKIELIESCKEDYELDVMNY
jgi:phage terminase large subunit